MTDIDWAALDRIQTAQQIAFQGMDARMCPIYVPGEGCNLKAFIVCPPPGALETVQRRPLVNSIGLVTRSLMGLAGLYGEWRSGDPVRDADMVNCWLTPVIKFKLPNNRTPYMPEIKTVRDFLRAEWIAVGRPKVIVTIGFTAALTIMGHHATLPVGRPVPMMGKDGEQLTVWQMMSPSLIPNVKYRERIEAHWVDLGTWLNDLDDTPNG